MKNQISTSPWLMSLLVLAFVTLSATSCGNRGALTPAAPQGAHTTSTGAVVRGKLDCGEDCDGTPTPAPTSSGQVTETGTVARLNVYGSGTPMFVLTAGSPYPVISVYGSATSNFQIGQQVAVSGDYHKGTTNQWIIATSITPANGSPLPSPLPSDTPTPGPSSTPIPPTPTPNPTPSTSGAIQHIELVMMENTGYDRVVGNSAMPYINNTLIPQGKLFTNSYALNHPSLPNYLALYSGSQQGTAGTDACPLSFAGPTLGSELTAAGLAFIGYAEEMPSPGSTLCASADGLYQGHHSPWIYFNEANFGQPYNGFPGSMPDVAFIVPDNCHNMHDPCGGSAWSHGDTYLSQQLPSIIAWNATHNGLLIVTWDESAYSTVPANHIATIMVGPMVTPGTSSQVINHYNVLRTITDAFGLAPLNGAGGITP